MKRITLFILAVFISIAAFAKDLTNDITMVSYEQSWLDNKGTLALKNNTNEEIRNVVFLIKYLDTSGNDLDYEEFSEYVSIAPGMTKKINIPAYEHGRNYHYYKTKDEFGHPAFKIEFVLRDYNVSEEDISESDDGSYSLFNYSYENDSSYENLGYYFLIGLIIIIIAIGINVGLFVLVAVMAQKRHRNVVLWVFLSIIATPLLMIIILLFIGDDYSNIENQSMTQNIES